MFPGEAYYVGPGHTGEVGLAGTQVVEFSPSDEYAKTMAVVAKNLQLARHRECRRYGASSGEPSARQDPPAVQEVCADRPAGPVE